MKTIFSSIVSRIYFIVSLSILIPVALSAQTSEDIKQYKLLAEQGHPEAQNNLGVCYCDGYGVPQSYSDAAEWYRKAAEQGLPVAQYNLGACYYNGDGVLQSYSEAKKWLRMAARQGFALSQQVLKSIGEDW